MREYERLALRCRLSDGDLLGLMREAAQDDRVSGVEDLTSEQIGVLTAVLRIMAAPVDVSDYCGGCSETWPAIFPPRAA